MIAKREMMGRYEGIKIEAEKQDGMLHRDLDYFLTYNWHQCISV